MKTVCLVLILAAALPGRAWAASVERFALVVGANEGGSDRPALRYAVSDADRFARVIAELGGVRPENAILLRQPKLGELEKALESLRLRVSEARRAGSGRTELLVYYSGHADEKGLLIGEDRYSYRSLRDRLDQVPADVRIAVLDACASGAITRLKGGRAQPAFLVDESSDMRGQAILTSSAATEAAQESDRIRGSYFTHYLVSGLRGAADVSGEGKVTLNEAYQFAFGETLGRTADTKGGPQHPSYDINLSGTGDVVMTDLRQTQATLVLGDAVDGRVFVRNAKQELVVELRKPLGRSVELGLEPGAYEVRVEREVAALVAKPQLADGARLVLDGAQFVAAPAKELTQRRGGPAPPAFAVAGRNRLDLRLGMFDVNGDEAAGVVVAGSSTADLLAGLRYTRFVSDRLAMTLGAEVLGATSGATVSSLGVNAGDTVVVAIPLGVRFNPTSGARETRAVKPYLDLSLGPVIGDATGTSVSARGVYAGDVVEVAIGGLVGGGVDFHVSRGFALGLSVGYHWMSDFSRPIGARDNYSGFQLALNVGWLFGKGSAAHE
jgi:caspase domain-containing protein